MVFRHVTLLSYMGHPEQAASLARPYLKSLVEQAARFDEQFLSQTAAVLDTLSRQGRLPAAAAGHGWGAALRAAYREGKARMGESDDG
jgi:hypothetical protein